MEISNLIPHIEALIFASDKPLTSIEITDLINQAFGFMEDKVTADQIDAALEGIVEKYNSEFYPFAVRQSGGGWQFLTKSDFHKTVAQLNGEKFFKRLSAAALETLAIVAYKQPVTKGEIEAIRGVSSDYAVQKLLEKELIVISGRNEKLPGHPLVYATSKNFMDYFGINTPDDLPKIKEVLADQIVEPTIVNHTDFEQSEVLAVSDDGELIANEDAGAKLFVDEPHVNGHAFGEEDKEQPTEDLKDEEVTEEFISDEIFVEGDVEEEIEQTEEELDSDVPDELSTDQRSKENNDNENGDENDADAANESSNH